ncbi:hypothetical protein LTR94_029540, partial [Friedmanniomyces endolithicus]
RAMNLKLIKGMRLVAATHNPGKAREIEALLDGHYTIVTAGELNLPEPDETESTFVGNAMLKARHAAQASGEVALADDSGLSVAALDGAPPPYWALSELIFDDRDSFDRAMDICGAALMGDAPRYTNVDPVLQISSLIDA